MAVQHRLEGSDDAEARKARHVAIRDDRSMLYPEALFPCHPVFFKRIQRAGDCAVANGVGVDLESLFARRADDLSEIRVFHRLQAMLFGRVTVRFCHLVAARAESAIENQLEASNGEHSVAKIGLRSAREIVCDRSEEHTSELQSRLHLVCRLLLEKKKE